MKRYTIRTEHNIGTTKGYTRAAVLIDKEDVPWYVEYFHKRGFVTIVRDPAIKTKYKWRATSPKRALTIGTLKILEQEFKKGCWRYCIIRTKRSK